MTLHKISDTQLKENMQENKWTSMTNSVQTALKAVLRREREYYTPIFTTLTVRGYILLWYHIQSKKMKKEKVSLCFSHLNCRGLMSLL